MAGTLNRVELIGRLTRDPQLRYTPNGTAVCNLGLATNRFGRDENNQPKEITDFHDIVVWNSQYRKLADITAQYLSKGRLVYVEGRLQTRSWDDPQSGQKRYKTEIIANDIQFLESKGQSSEKPVNGESPAMDNSDQTPQNGTGGLSQEELERRSSIDPDEVPF